MPGIYEASQQTAKPSESLELAWHPQWTRLAVDPSPSICPIVDSVSGDRFALILKLLYFEHLSFIRHSTLYT